MSLKRLAPAYPASLTFDGVFGQSALTSAGSSAVAAFPSTQDFSVSLAMKSDADAISQVALIGTTNSGTTGWEIITGSSTRDLRITLRGSTQHDISEVTGINVRDGEWHEVCMVVTDSLVSVYKDGQLFKNYSAAWVGDAGGDLYVGDRGSTGTVDFAGKMQDVKLYNKALTAKEVQLNFFDRITPSNLVLHYKMDEASGSIAADSVGSFDLTLLAGNEWSGDTLK